MMYTDTSKGPFCQSCGMPMYRASDFGMGADGLRINDYCHFCFDGGEFTEPDITQQAMIDQCVKFMTRQTFTPEPEVRTLMMNVIPRLKRWSSESVGAACRVSPGVRHDSNWGGK
jgi:hypothetical protein